jgi:type III pantothenate kinase
MSRSAEEKIPKKSCKNNFGNILKQLLKTTFNFQLSTFNLLNLTIDIGNTSAKAALFDKGQLIESFPTFNFQLSTFNYDNAIIVSTRGEVPEIEQVVRERAARFIRFDRNTPVPLKNLYGTPETLGYDRLAAAVGAHVLFPDDNVLTVDFGTAITYDVVTAAGEFLGGNIAPGAAMRFRALHEMTASLPLCELSGNLAEPPRPLRVHPSTGGEPSARAACVSSLTQCRLSPQAVEASCEGDNILPTRTINLLPEFPGRTTREAIEGGVVTGIVAETEYYIGLVKRKFGQVKIIFTGGDADYFVRRVNFPIFATSELVFYGLNAILEHNDKL